MPSRSFESWCEQFGRTRHIAPVSLGMTRPELTEVFGPPDDHSADAPRGRASVWKYGEFEFHFDAANGALSLIYREKGGAVYVSIPRSPPGGSRTSGRPRSA